jgi:hypothetical protein
MKLALGGNEFAYGLLNEEGQFVAIFAYRESLEGVDFASTHTDEQLKAFFEAAAELKKQMKF